MRRPYRRTARLVAAAVAAAALLPAGARAAAESDTVLVKLAAGATPADRAEVTAALDAEASSGLPGGWRAYRLPEDVTLAEARADLAAAGADRAVELDQTMRVQATNDPSWPQLWGMQRIDAEGAWQMAGPLGRVRVAVVDTGISATHPDLAGRTAVFRDFIGTQTQPYDDHGHGTHVSGTIAAIAGNGVGVAGVVPADLVVAKGLNSGGSGQLVTLLQAMNWAADNGARVINNSWGGGWSQAVCDTVQALSNRGVLVVSAAGNDNGDRDTSPGTWNCPAENLIVVGASNDYDRKASFSAFGATTVDIMAPGVGIASTIPGATYQSWSGTSMASPHVAGVAGLLIARDPAITAGQVKTAIMTGGDPAPEAGPTVSGRRLNARGALATLAPDTDPPAPFTVTAGPATGALTAARRHTVAWTASTDAGSGVARYVVRRTGGEAIAEVPGTATTVEATFPEGQYTWWVEAQDGWGNVRSTAGRDLRLDATAPAAPAPLTPAMGATTGLRPQFTWRAATDGFTGVTAYLVRIDGQEAARVTGTSWEPAAALTSAVHTWSVSAVDAAGNVSPATVVAFSAVGPAPAPDGPGTSPAPPAAPATPSTPASPKRRARRVVIRFTPPRGAVQMLVSTRRDLAGAPWTPVAAAAVIEVPATARTVTVQIRFRVRTHTGGLALVGRSAVIPLPAA